MTTEVSYPHLVPLLALSAPQAERAGDTLVADRATVTAAKYTPRRSDLSRRLGWWESPSPLGTSDETIPSNSRWVPYVHPKGSVYWHNEARRAVFANHAYDHTNEDKNERLLRAIDVLWEGVCTVHTDYELFIDVDHNSNGSVFRTRYYFVDWKKRTIFWRIPEMIQAVSPAHLEIQARNPIGDHLTAQFWAHVDAYPMHHPLPTHSHEELINLIGYYIIDHSRFSVACQASQSEEAGIAAAGVARIWRDIYDLRVLNYYGDKTAKVARVDRNKAPVPETHPWLRFVCSTFFFNRPDRLEASLKELFDDGNLYKIHWQSYMKDEIEPEWQQQGTMATIMLAANMAFLALGSVGAAAGAFSVATLFATMNLARTHRRMRSASAEEAKKYMTYCSNRMLGLFGLAIMYSLPFTMFMWSLMTFVAAVVLYAFGDWTPGAGLPLITTTLLPIVALLSCQLWFFEAREWKAVAAPAVDSAPALTTNGESVNPQGQQNSRSWWHTSCLKRQTWHSKLQTNSAAFARRWRYGSRDTEGERDVELEAGVAGHPLQHPEERRRGKVSMSGENIRYQQAYVKVHGPMAEEGRRPTWAYSACMTVCQEYVAHVLADVAPRWNIDTAHTQNDSRDLADSMRMFTNYLGIGTAPPDAIADREAGIRE
ncbi:hypothetical protein EXIGLDRAFT_750981 [Exidia glandulosa HHB12029]|uniref:WW domain-containing protein n=1 Tax=Exidia glandulosa HHB12029 TaxID=1314781 RepID=A0A165G0T9_EXIGL|nr:hypothetical protein EXIGLDRAFT_750981 [Exidia glandulosa HHB12029]